MTTTCLPLQLDRLADISDRYDGYLVDQWGVLHNGADVYPEALAALAALKKAGKKVIILSNSGRTGAENAHLMAAMGIGAELYDRILSAGDDAYDALIGQRDRAYAGLGRKVLVLGRKTDRPPLLDHGYEQVAHARQADFVFLLSMEVADRIPQIWLSELQIAARLGLPLICANPDMERVNGEGEILVAPGAVAALYEQMGGTSHYHGKPHPRIYRTAIVELGLSPSRVLGVGDSLLHDVAGAQQSGLDSLFVLHGVHRDKIDVSIPETLIQEIAAHAPHRPTWMIDQLR
ncbi:TIGR01459 family HAD-type hydrolase (plasmid) [Paracoccus methylovorus]|uniref:TIGR01459 family HAD-type hydrolase n=1 Tax=Paracoccus methylovorus TaxID=2812658 RepID=A0ABX7JQP2_9RHOB|nr:TIGR01459 family HAD-type hydrolase [Paracoccus methylovorus]QRZ16235.1 TIGR01459 family HAD-type hydrolase [Paracoccus methylovorus]